MGAEATTVPRSDSARTQALWLVAAGATYAAVAVAAAVILAGRFADGEAGRGEVVHVVALATFAVAYFPFVGPWYATWLLRLATPGLIAATLSAVVAVATLPNGPAPVLFILTAAFAAHALPQRLAFGLIAAQTLVILGTSLVAIGEPANAIVQTAAFGGFQVFALTNSLALLSERSLRQRLALANAELRGARALLESTSRQGERLRIARELHDLVGHHLTALALQLEVADHVVEGRARKPVERARAIARLLLADVRDVVSDLRERELDLSALVRAVVADLPGPRVVLDLPDALEVDDAERAHAVLRLVQEALTNAVRHGDAEHVWIALRRDGDAVHVEARDDGRGVAVIRPGNGLRGMRERLGSVGGVVELTSAPGRGFTVSARLPLTGGNA